MSGVPPPAPVAEHAQRVYARVLEIATRLGFVALVASFAAYLFGGLPPHVPVDRLPEVWRHPVADYLQVSGMPYGWQWLARLGEGDVVTLAGIVMLAGAPMLALLAVVPRFARARDARVHLVLCALELAVLLLAASAVLGRGP